MNIKELKALTKMADRRQILIATINNTFKTTNVSVRGNGITVLDMDMCSGMSRMEYCDMLTIGMRTEVGRIEELLKANGIDIDPVVDETV